MFKMKQRRKRTLKNRFISGFNTLRFAMTEPMLLRIARIRYEQLYSNPQSTPLVSVCVPTYNRGELLIKRAITSVLFQTYSNIELIVVGDHCTDNTAELISQIKDPRLRFYNLPIRKRNYPQTVENHWFVGGAVPANRAMELARGQWLARVDDDDIWTPDHIEVLLRFAQKNQYELVSGSYVAERFGKKVIVSGDRVRSSYYAHKNANSIDTSPKIGGIQTWLYRSYLRFIKYNLDCWQKNWNCVWDADLAQRIYKAGARIGFIDQVLAYVLPRPGESTIGLDAYKLAEQEKLKQYEF